MLRAAASRCARAAAAAASEHAVAARACSGPQLERLLCCALSSGQPTSSHQWQPHSVPSRGFSSAAPGEDEEVREVGSESVRRLAGEIMQLSLLEVSDLTEILMKRLNIQMPSMGMPMGGGMPAGGAAQPAAAAAPAEEPKEAKTDFDVKLTGFEASAKVKVIKEVRSMMPELGLKEAKELVEKAPTVIKAGVKKEDAEELKKKLEAVGGKVTLE